MALRWVPAVGESKPGQRVRTPLPSRWLGAQGPGAQLGAGRAVCIEEKCWLCLAGHGVAAVLVQDLAGVPTGLLAVVPNLGTAGSTLQTGQEQRVSHG